MKRLLLSALAAAVALSSLAGTPALAQGWDPGRDGPPPHARAQDHRGPDRHDDRRFEERRPERPHWRAGERLPRDYRAKRYVIAKPAAYHLHRPPRGHHWVRVGPDALLVVSATGIVVELAPGLFR